MQIVLISDNIEKNADLLREAEPLHRQLRPNIPAPYPRYMEAMFREGAEMSLLLEEGIIRALAVFRCHHTTFHGHRFYLDDLVTDEVRRAKGLGAKLISWCEREAVARGCNVFDLESGTQRPQTHKFYFRQGLTIFAFGFSKPLPQPLKSLVSQK